LRGLERIHSTHEQLCKGYITESGMDQSISSLKRVLWWNTIGSSPCSEFTRHEGAVHSWTAVYHSNKNTINFLHTNNKAELKMKVLLSTYKSTSTKEAYKTGKSEIYHK
jgi:hypothetical protein